MLVLEWIMFVDQATSLTQSLWPLSVWSSTHCSFESSLHILIRLSQPPDTNRLALKPDDADDDGWLSSCGNTGAQLIELQPVFVNTNNKILIKINQRKQSINNLNQYWMSVLDFSRLPSAVARQWHDANGAVRTSACKNETVLWRSPCNTIHFKRIEFFKLKKEEEMKWSENRKPDDSWPRYS